MPESMIETYYKLCEKHTGCIVFFQVGSFYEYYAWENSLSKNSNYPWFHGGMNDESIDKISDILRDKKTSKSTSKEHSVTNPYMVGFPVDKAEQRINLLSSHGYRVVKYKQVKDGNEIERVFESCTSPGMKHDGESKCMFIYYINSNDIGVAIVDITTETIMIGELPSISELFMMIRIYQPNEYILFTIDGNIPFDLCHLSPITESIMIRKNNLSYVENVLANTWDLGHQFHTPIEELHLCGLTTTCDCLVHAIVYIQQMFPNTYLHKPVFLQERKYCKLHNHAIHQLDISLLFPYLNFTKTSIGKKKLYHQLTNPCVNEEEIECYHDDCDRWKSLCSSFQQKLRSITNLEVLTNKFIKGSISLEEMSNTYTDFIIAESIVVESETNTEMIRTLFEPYFDDNGIKESKTLKKTNKEFANIVKQLNKLKDFYDCKLDGCMFYDTPNRVKKLKQRIINEEEIKIYGFSLSENVYSRQITKTKEEIYNTEIQTLQHEYTKLKEKIDEEHELIRNKIIDMFRNHKQEFHKLTEQVAYIDTICSRIQYANTYSGTKANIVSHSSSYVQATNVRHLYLQETIEETFIGNDVDLTKGMLLYGINGAGKSCFLKSVGIAVVMAQAGFLVQADTFTLCPFHDIFMRVDCNDNIAKHQSSYQVEINELGFILHVCNERSLVLGDEILKSTEQHSANYVAATTIELMKQKKTKFILATHLHKLHTMVDVPVFHIEAYTEPKKKEIQYKRKLKTGPCKDVYGLEIAQLLLNSQEFNKTLSKIKTQYERPIQKSKYNSKLWLLRCEICNTEDDLETHHIKPQHQYPELTKTLSNLVCLCKSCHTDVHRQAICIERWQKTRLGKVLIYSKCS